jgi:hypothetical protein
VSANRGTWTLRVLLALPGLAALAWGVMLLVQLAFPLDPDSYSVAEWLVAGPLAHDAVLAPIVGVIGFGLSRVTSRAWRGPVMAGAVFSGVLGLLAVPLLWRRFGTPPSPGLHDGDSVAGLLWTLAAVWTAVLLTGVVRWACGYPRAPAGTK